MRVSVAWKKAVETFRHGFFARPRPTSSNISPSSFSSYFPWDPLLNYPNATWPILLMKSTPSKLLNRDRVGGESGRESPAQLKWITVAQQAQ